jgi:hypothetical protein
MNTSDKIQAQCFCGSVRLTLAGAPAAMGYCHCSDCRHWSAGPVNAFTLWDPAMVTIDAGSEYIATYNKTPNSYRKWCSQCGGHIMTDHPGMKLVDVYAAVISTLEFQPSLHVFYGEKMLAVKDGLPKMKDMPAEMGGSGTVLPE